MRSGILLVDKPAGMTSHDVTHAIARRLGAKAGHTGTLDKFATGLLLVCVGSATRASEYLTSLSKRYLAAAVLGTSTDTYDTSGREVFSSPAVPEREAVDKAAARFVGPISQVPPPYSAKKIRGRRASDYARQGVDVEVKPANVTIHELKIVDYSYPDLRLMVSCSSGTYIRSLVKDMGDVLGCGAVTKELRRSAIGEFQVERAVTFDSLMGEDPAETQKRVVLTHDALYFFPAVSLDDEQARQFEHGRGVKKTGGTGMLRVFKEGGEFIGVGRMKGDLLAPEKVFALRRNA
ncbi:MAG: tRNA pseudouridine(55) synthase TruB [Pseudomonadota bacterium]